MRPPFPLPTIAKRGSLRFWLLSGGLLILALGLFDGAARLAAQTAPTPVVPPNAEAGLQLFATRCASCHGPLGQGDGEMAADLPVPPANYSAPGFLDTAVPVDLFDTITNGRLESGMPPFGPTSSNPLSEAARWDAVAAVYSLGTPPETIIAGRELYEAGCLECHGADGDEAALDLSDAAYWAVRSNQEVVEQLAQPLPEHSFELPEAERRAVVDYSRSLSYRYLDPARLTEPVPAATISGTVLNETTGAILAAGTADLLIFEEMSLVDTLTTTVGADGRYQFDLVEVPPNQIYAVQVGYAGLNFNSNIGRLRHTEPHLDLPVAVFDTTTEAGAIFVERVHIILEFGGDQMLVNEFYQFSNQGTTVYVGENGRPEQGTVAVSLPEGATNPLFQRSFGSLQDFLPADDLIPSGRNWLETTPIFPGSTVLSLLVRYDMAYESGMSLAHPVNYDTGEVNLILPLVGVELANAAGWVAGPEQTMAEGSFINYIQSELPAGETVNVELTGRPRTAAPAASGNTLVRNETIELAVGGGILVVAMGVAAYFFTTWRGAEPALDEPEALLEAIAELDDAYEAGEIAAEDYEWEREQLKEELVALWED